MIGQIPFWWSPILKCMCVGVFYLCLSFSLFYTFDFKIIWDPVINSTSDLILIDFVTIGYFEDDIRYTVSLFRITCSVRKTQL